MLSTFVEYACHNILYSAFKETSSKNFKKNPTPVLRSNEYKIANYSKVLASSKPITYSDIECEVLTYDSAYPVDRIKNKPSKENNFHFLKLSEVDLIGEDEKIPEVTINESNTNEQAADKVKSQEANRFSGFYSYVPEPSFPFNVLTSISVFIVILFFFYKVYFNKKRVKLKKILSSKKEGFKKWFFRAGFLVLL